MLKCAKQWYADTHRHHRYGWGITISGVIGLAVFCYKTWEGEGYSQAYYGGGLSFSFVIAVLVFPQGIVDFIRDLRRLGWGYWRLRSHLDEMEKAISHRVREISFMAFYGYIGAALLGIMAYYNALGVDHISIDLLFTTLMGGVLVLIWAQGIAFVVLYSRQDNTSVLEDMPVRESPAHRRGGGR